MFPTKMRRNLRFGWYGQASGRWYGSKFTRKLAGVGLLRVALGHAQFRRRLRGEGALQKAGELPFGLRRSQLVTIASPTTMRCAASVTVWKFGFGTLRKFKTSDLGRILDRRQQSRISKFENHQNDVEKNLRNMATSGFAGSSSFRKARSIAPAEEMTSLRGSRFA